MLNVGDVLGGIYEITEKIGSGGGGIIFKANHLRMKKTVAIKLIKDNVKNILENRAEVDLLKNLKNEYLPQVLDFVEDNNDVYTVMEFIEGENFKQLISAGKSFDKKAVNKYAVQLCEAVEYLHSQKPPIIHSDIKPANIMLTPEDKICLIDFNISSVSDGSGAYSVGGSAGYAAPEQFKKIVDVPIEADEFHEETRFISDDDATEIIDDDATEIIEDTSETTDNFNTNSSTSPSSVIVKNESKKTGKAYIDTRTDIYGIGASLHYIITGRRPIDGKTDFRGVNISKKMQRIISKAMASDPDHRYKSVSEMKKDIENNNTLKIGITAAIAAVIAAVIAVTAAVYPNADIELKTSSLAYSYGSEFVIEKTHENKMYGANVSDKYNATAVSLMNAAYNYYYNSYKYPENAEYFSASKAVTDMIDTFKEKNDLDVQVIESSFSSVYNGKLEPGSGEEFEYLYNNFTNYTDEDELYVFWKFTDGKITNMIISDDPNLYNAITTGTILKGHIGAAVTTAVNDVELSYSDQADINSYLNSEYEKSLIEIAGTKYNPSTESLYLGSQNLYEIDVSSLSKFTNLKEITLYGAKNVDFSIFPVLPTVEKITPNYANIKSLDGIVEKLPNLKELDISGTNVSDLSPLAELNSLENLDIYNCDSILDLSPLANHENLKTLNIGSLVFKDSSFMDDISTLKNLKSLDLLYVAYINGKGNDGNDEKEYLSNINFLKNLTKLEELTITYIEDISILENFKELKLLEIHSPFHNNYDIQYFLPIKNISKLEKLIIHSGIEWDTSIFENLNNIKELEITMERDFDNDYNFNYAYINASEFLKYAANMKKLEKLTLSYIKLSEADIDTICGLASLSSLSITSDISDEDIKKIENAFPNCELILTKKHFEVFEKERDYEEDDPVFEEDEPVGKEDDDELFLTTFSDCKDKVTLSETTGNKEIDEFAKLMPNKIYFPGNLPLSEVYESGVTEYDDGSVICNVFYDQYYAETGYGVYVSSLEHIAYKYSMIEKGYHVQNNLEKGKRSYIYTDTGELVAVVIDYGGCFCISFFDYYADNIS